MWYVYILECRSGSYYTGVTTDVSRRFEEHRSGGGARYTKSNPPIRVLFSKRCKTRSSALRREAAIRCLTRLEKEALVEGRDALR
jgi:putative endonuclease